MGNIAFNKKRSYYKYRPLYKGGVTNNGSREVDPFTHAILKEGKIWYSSPEDFNDPFDCNLLPHTRDSTQAEWIRYIDDLSMGRPKKDRKILHAIRKNKAWDHLGETLQQQIARTIIQINRSSSVFCLSRKSNSIPMFSYYADAHRGVAIEFQFSDREIPCGIPFDQINERGMAYAGLVSKMNVSYKRAFPELNYHRLKGKIELIKSLIYSKFISWKHEEECRIYRFTVKKSAVSFDKKLVTKIIFGCNTSIQDMKMVKSWVSEWPSNIILSKAEKSPDSYSLVIKDIMSSKD